MENKKKELDEQLDARQKQILGLKKQNLEDRLRVVQGEMSEQQIGELREQFRKEMNQLEATIKAEKKKQLNNMRANMLNRRIAKEKKKKQAEEEIVRIQKKQQILKFNS